MAEREKFQPDDRLIDKLCDVLVEHRATLTDGTMQHNAENLLYLAGITCGAAGILASSLIFMDGIIEGQNRKAQAEADAEMLDQDPPGIDQWGTNGGKEPDESGC